MGKSALLEYAISSAHDFRVLRSAGIESEIKLPFAALHQLCAPILDLRGHLPGPQKVALEAALGLDGGPAVNRFFVGVATLSLLAEVAGERPLLCVIDDAQWLDHASAGAFAFVARRLRAEPITLVFAGQEPFDVPEMTGLPELMVGGLTEADAGALLDSTLPGRLDERVRARIIAESRGNPLALLELPRGLSPGELAGGFALPDARPLRDRIERSFVRQVRSLPLDTQRLLLIASAEPIGDVSLLWRAAERLSIGADALAPAEAVGLLDLGARVRFRHPLLRSAIYRSASPTERRDAHRALAEATDPAADPDRRTWHRAQAAAGLDDSVADDLEDSADRAGRRGGVAAVAAFLERAAELTRDPARRGARAFAAAQAKLDAGAMEAAQTLLATAELAPLDELQRARIERLRGQIVFAHKRGSDAPPLLLNAARRFEPLDSAAARETYVEALGAAIFAGRDTRTAGVVETAEAARGAPSPSGPPRDIDLLLDGLAVRFTQPYAEAVPILVRAVHALAPSSGRDGHEVRWLWVSCPVMPEPLAPELWDDETWHDLADHAVSVARNTGALTVLPTALTYRAGVHLHAGEFAEASALVAESVAISEATGQAPFRSASMLLLAWQGQEVAALSAIESGMQEAKRRGEGRAIGVADYATAVLYNGLSRYSDALAAAQHGCAYEDLGFFGWALVELIEAAVRSDARDAACDALSQLDERTSASGTDWALGVRARSAALLNKGPTAEALFREALERLARTRIAVHLARAHLVYGEWLRRENRRMDAREQLRAAIEMFGRMGADAFAERARRELLATGETARPRTDKALDALTPQEAHIAQLAREGLSNADIGAQLFISPRTVQYHLSKIFAKLDINSRNRLARVPRSRLSLR